MARRVNGVAAKRGTYADGGVLVPWITEIDGDSDVVGGARRLSVVDLDL